MPSITLHRGEDGKLAGLTERDQRAWVKFRKLVDSIGLGSIRFTYRVPRSGPYHRRFFLIIGRVFDCQDRFTNDERFLDWLKVGAGHADLFPGRDGQPVAVPRSINWETLDQVEFEHVAYPIFAFLRSLHATRYLWPYLSDHDGLAMIETIFAEFGE